MTSFGDESEKISNIPKPIKAGCYFSFFRLYNIIFSSFHFYLSFCLSLFVLSIFLSVEHTHTDTQYTQKEHKWKFPFFSFSTILTMEQNDAGLLSSR